jgi:hypothetical protein
MLIKLMRMPFRAVTCLLLFTPSVALGWHVIVPLALKT